MSPLATLLLLWRAAPRPKAPRSPEPKGGPALAGWHFLPGRPGTFSQCICSHAVACTARRLCRPAVISTGVALCTAPLPVWWRGRTRVRRALCSSLSIGASYILSARLFEHLHASSVVTGSSYLSKHSKVPGAIGREECHTLNYEQEACRRQRCAGRQIVVHVKSHHGSAC